MTPNLMMPPERAATIQASASKHPALSEPLGIRATVIVEQTPLLVVRHDAQTSLSGCSCVSRPALGKFRRTDGTQCSVQRYLGRLGPNFVVALRRCRTPLFVVMAASRTRTASSQTHTAGMIMVLRVPWCVSSVRLRDDVTESARSSPGVTGTKPRISS